MNDSLGHQVEMLQRLVPLLVVLQVVVLVGIAALGVSIPSSYSRVLRRQRQMQNDLLQRVARALSSIYEPDKPAGDASDADLLLVHHPDGRIERIEPLPAEMPMLTAAALAGHGGWYAA